MPGPGPQQHRIPRQDRLRPPTADPVGESQQDHKPRYIQKIIYMHEHQKQSKSADAVVKPSNYKKVSAPF